MKSGCWLIMIQRSHWSHVNALNNCVTWKEAFSLSLPGKSQQKLTNCCLSPNAKVLDFEFMTQKSKTDYFLFVFNSFSHSDGFWVFYFIYIFYKNDYDHYNTHIYTCVPLCIHLYIYLFTKKSQVKAKIYNILIQTYNYNTVYVTGKTWVKRLKSWQMNAYCECMFEWFFYFFYLDCESITIVLNKNKSYNV